MHARCLFCFSCLLSILFAPTAHSQVASALIRAGEPLPGDVLGSAITSISNTANNASGGYAFTCVTDDSFSNVWGSRLGEPGTVLQSEQTIGDLTITALESFFGMSDEGAVFYGTTSTSSSSGETGLDGVFLDDTVILNEEEAVPTLPGLFSTFNSRPGISGSGVPYWVGGVSTIQGGTTERRVLFQGLGANVVIQGGDMVGGVPEPLTTGSSVDFDVRFSGSGTNYIMAGDVVSASAINTVVVSNGSVVSSGGALLREGTPIPPAIGGIGDAYDNFDFMGITESGGYMVTGDTDAASANDEFIMIDGMIVLREGDTVGAGTLSGSMEGAYLNQDGDWAAVWDYDVDGSNLEVLIVNGEPVLTEGDAVDFNGDGVINVADMGAVLDDFNGISAMTISRRSGSGDIRV